MVNGEKVSSLEQLADGAVPQQCLTWPLLAWLTFIFENPPGVLCSFLSLFSLCTFVSEEFSSGSPLRLADSEMEALAPVPGR